MKLENQVCSLELAKKLKELGVTQESHFQWAYCGDHEYQDDDPEWKVVPQERYFVLMQDAKAYAAFTVAELGEMHGFKKWQCHTAFVNAKPGWEWICVSKSNDAARQYAATEADARAKMLVYLIENKLITL